MAKNTRAQEVSTGTADSYTEHEKSDENPPPRIQRAMLGGDTPLVGTDSSEFSQSDRPLSEPESHNRRAPARTTENLSAQMDKADSTVNLTDGDGPETETESVEDVPPYEQWTYAELQAECKERQLSAKGSTDELIARLKESDEATSEEDEDDEDDFA